ncbi:ribonuclease H-like domain-containing protein [Elsinoe ampelina]|uniref:Ribonuclease H-like domain-containing protein n=1 Tax=Elsinoe ampelina TaxID=302913 RepID=A0A6A6FZT7_9PEZI|nr:ribonuclease H-like domain-containing protein [Elsinoe ampelina]
MDVNRFQFPARLLEILTAVSESHFVALDLELSGVPVRPYGASHAGKQTLQQRYAEIRLAAQKYTILQVGLTCVKEDTIDGRYELKPFNVNLNPTLSERLDVDRDFSFHSGAVEFLNSVGFNFQAPLAIGVPYLSRDEAKLAEQRAEERLSRTNDFYEPMVIKPEETEALALQKKINLLVKNWLKTPSGEAEPLTIGPREITSLPVPPEELSRYEKRLIHQIVRSDFEKLVTFPRRGTIQVRHLDQDREDAIKRQKMKETKERIYRQTGFRWVIEAIAGRSFANIDWQTFVEYNEEGQIIPANFDIKARFQRCQHLLQNKPRPVIGHNMFLDLIYLYQTFIGQLPETVEGFASKINELFPVIVDTKYVATHECGDINPMSSLQQIAEQMDQHDKPTTNTHGNFVKYDDYAAHHEAGYDSMLTAKVAIKLSSKLEADRTPVEGPNGLDAGSSEDDGPGGVAVDADQESKSTLGSVLQTVKTKIVVPIKETMTASKSSKKTPTTNQPSRFAHATAFDGLQEDDAKDTPAEEDPVVQFDDLPTATDQDDALETWDQGPVDPDLQDQNWTDEIMKWVPRRLMPRWTAEFWQEYGNRLRVFGTQESLCVLAPGPNSVIKDRDAKAVQW